MRWRACVLAHGGAAPRSLRTRRVLRIPPKGARKTEPAAVAAGRAVHAGGARFVEVAPLGLVGDAAEGHATGAAVA